MPTATSPSPLRASAVLLGITAVWGLTFLWGRDAMLAAEATAEAAGLRPGALRDPAAAGFVALRFAIAWVGLWAAGRLPRLGWLWPPADRGAGITGAAVGGLLLAGFLLQMTALAELDASVTAFLTSLYVVFTALLAALLARRVPRGTTLLGVILATLGAGFIDGPPQVSFALSEWLTVASAVLFAGSILATDRFTKVHEPLVFTRVGFATVAVGGAAWFGVTLIGSEPGTVAALGELLMLRAFLWPLLCCALLATTIALTLINLYQRHVDPVRAAVLYALEPVWAAIWVLALEGGVPGPWLLGGGAALLAGNLVAELAPRLR
ncbi:DMT family transporter [Engelhardtia mirabilis]|uniref:EamA-like transporter family protein n=1 Tax=Engelhardtia mirabilis TaxID=2528011 RepID=A0A518BHD1_9BACT|nr:EamA-like transporter family protein [Planctomycetes bacterium Pla133]QDV00702.1 EamA-like transporter family protein [Planctomycetes bacterium Pla86]